ncbi:MAG: hypothetical protein UW94_C0001G0102 [Parcubacteria group bacterium GW2011_GWA2_45_14]|nr:MAG: hypothetical protein UW94_C0001G0102 [Parcubacteria group bacterium GW2011_GWA2_45_14]OGY35755.1 MAG: hypothetical protein A3B76_03520 [Candidatus Andersenbacteria bacterium RIFCSPHIGHO2_02_FULL_46_16]
MVFTILIHKNRALSTYLSTMNPQIKKHFAITVHYGDPAPTNRTVQSLLQNNDPPDFIIVINHGPTGLSLKTNPRLVQLNPPNNAGYAAGINMGLGVISTLQASPSDIITCLNNDVIVPRDTFTKLRQWWSDYPDNILLGLTVHQPNQPPQLSGQVNLLTGRCRLTNIALPTHQNRHLFTLPYIHGACFSAPLNLLLLNHGLPSEYFMYWEDVLFSQQTMRRHLPLRTASNITVIHDEESSDSAASTKKTYYLVRNGALFLERETFWPWRCYWWIANRLRYAYHRLRRRHPVVIQALRDAINRTTGPAPMPLSNY